MAHKNKKSLAVQTSPAVLVEQATALYNQAEILFAQQKYQAALDLLQKSAQILAGRPQLAVAGLYQAMAKCYHHLGQGDKAIEVVQKELALHPDDLRLRHLHKYLQSPYARSKNIGLDFDGQTAPGWWPSVSLCMIVKNEEAHLADCLKSVGDLPTEIIIVDTGSTDRTVEIAQEFGARVKYFAWCDDFAAARNESIRDAVGDWIFWMDADDRLTPTSLNQVKQAAVSNLASAYILLVQSWEGNQSTQAHHFRLFKNGLGLKFEGALHEKLNVDKLGLTLARTNIVVQHTGYAVDPEVKRRKFRRNSQIIQKMLVADPENLYWRHHLGVCLAGLEDYAGAVREFERVLVDPPLELSLEFDIYQAFVASIGAYYHLNRFDELEKIIPKAIKVYPNHSHLHAFIGQIYLASGQPALATPHLETAQKLLATPSKQEMAFQAGKISHWLSRVYLQQKEYAPARQNLARSNQEAGRAAVTLNPGDYGAAQTLLNNKEYPQVIQAYFAYVYQDAALARLVAQAFVGLQQWGKAVEALENAIILSAPQPGEWALLAEYIAHENVAVARHYANMALAEADNDARALNLLGIIAFQRQTDLPQAAAYFIKAVVANPEFAPAFNNLTQLAGAMASTPLVLLREHGQRLLSQKQAQAAVDVFAAIINKYPTEAETYRSLAVALQQLGRPEDALWAWQTAAQVEKQ